MGRFTGKVAIVTGANSGIGEATALQLAREGASVVLAARRLDKLQAVVATIHAQGGIALAVAGDVSSAADCNAIAKAAADTYGHIDILVNNAGIADKHRPITRCDDAWWDEVVRIDQYSVFYMTRAVLAYMEPAASGSIVNVSSIGGVFGSAGISYSAAKSAVLGMTKNVAIQFAGHGIRCNAVCPGPTPTSLNTPDKLADFDPFAHVCARHMNTTLPEASAQDQCNAILFFASDDATAVTGQILVVDHGTTL